MSAAAIESEVSTIVCPGCGSASKVALRTSVNVTVDPSLKAALLSGALLRFACEKCGRSMRMAHPLLYADTGRDFFVQLDPEGALEPSRVETGSRGPVAGHRVSRLVRDGNALIEKIRIDDAGLDDRVVEVLKVVLAAVHPNYAGFPWYFEQLAQAPSGGAPQLQFTILSPQGPLATRRPKTEYDLLATDMGRRGLLGSERPFVTIDHDYAMRAQLGAAPAGDA